jgi:hypothetical protein
LKEINEVRIKEGTGGRKDERKKYGKKGHREDEGKTRRTEEKLEFFCCSPNPLV